jgi:hypothetical protein
MDGTKFHHNNKIQCPGDHLLHQNDLIFQETFELNSNVTPLPAMATTTKDFPLSNAHQGRCLFDRKKISFTLKLKTVSTER